MRTSLHRLAPLWKQLEALGDAQSWHAQLLAAYGEPQRAYHTRQHLEECLQVFDEAKESGLIQRPDLIEIALWFHDAVYDPTSSENEALSAQMATDALGDTGTAREVARLIMLTKSHQPGTGTDDAWIIDIDLAIFAQPLERVLEYERQIRQEYDWVPEQIYRQKRAEVLKGFRDHECIYQTEWARHRLEKSARENLNRLITNIAAATTTL